MKSSFHGSPKESGMIHGGKGGSKELRLGADMMHGGKGKTLASSSFEGGRNTSGNVKKIKTYNQE